MIELAKPSLHDDSYFVFDNDVSTAHVHCWSRVHQANGVDKL